VVDILGSTKPSTAKIQHMENVVFPVFDRSDSRFGFLVVFG
jgi:hypothetical protein